jgi:hypothetical protein
MRPRSSLVVRLSAARIAVALLVAAPSAQTVAIRLATVILT